MKHCHLTRLLGVIDMEKICDFCNSDTEPTENYAYDSKALNALIKVCLCKNCLIKERKNIKGRFVEGNKRWMLEST